MDDTVPFLMTLAAIVMGTLAILSETLTWLLWLFGAFVLGAILFAIGHGVAALIEHFRRIRREQRQVALSRERERQAEIEALIRRCEIQHEYLQAGLINNNQRKIDHGTYGNYRPVKLPA